MSGTTITGTGGNDSLTVSSGSQTIDGLGGDDTLVGATQADFLIGGTGRDYIYGDNQTDLIWTGAFEGVDDGDSDTVVGGQSDDTVYAGKGDYLVGGTSTDTAHLIGTGWHVVTVSGGGTLTTTAAIDLNGDGDTSDNTGGQSESSITFDVWQQGDDTTTRAFLNGFESVDTVPCFHEDTRVMTARGEVAVKDLAIGDMVVTAHGRGPVLQPVVWIGKRRVNLARHPNRAVAEPILIRAGALGENVPFRDLRVSPEHALFVEGRLVPAGLLVNGTSIVREPWWRVVTWYHVELPEHGLLMAEGAPAESYFDAGNRSMFGEGALAALFPDFGAQRNERRYEEAACFPLLREEGPALDATRAKLKDRAAAVFGAAPAAPAQAREPGWAIRVRRARANGVR
jgi:hypothetical protein